MGTPSWLAEISNPNLNLIWVSLLMLFIEMKWRGGYPCYWTIYNIKSESAYESYFWNNLPEQINLETPVRFMF